MIFTEFPLDDAAGVLLAHTAHLPDGKLRKGRMLTADDLDRLRAAGIEQVLGARLEPGDLVEEAAVGMLAAALAGAGIVADPPGHGRANLRAIDGGVLVLERHLVDRLNGIDEALSVATLVPRSPVAAGQVVATIKAVTMAIPQSLVDTWLAQLEPGTVFTVAPCHRRRVALLLTEAAQLKPALLDKTAASATTRVAACGSELVTEYRCAHAVESIAATLQRAVSAGCDALLISGAVATVDHGDIIPAALARAGGRLERLGMPLEPGSLLSLARIGEMPVMILPGCARSPVRNGVDRVLAPWLADLPFTPDETARLGCGGLLHGADNAG